MNVPHAFVFVRHENQVVLGRAIQRINAGRRQRLFYRSLIVTEPRQGWMALLLGNGVTDHLLLRNLSGQLNTVAFELEINLFAFAYRLHRGGRTVSAFESHLPFYINDRLHLLEQQPDPNILDLAEPVERFVLRRFHAQQHATAFDAGHPDIPDDLQAHYAGNAAALHPVLRDDADMEYVATLLAPGFNPQVAFERLLALLNLPYLPPDQVVVMVGGDTIRRVTGYAITTPATWRDALPGGWQRLAAMPPKQGQAHLKTDSGGS